MSKKCLEEGCKKVPNFNYPEENTGIYCNEHKKANMEDVVSKRCLEEGSKKG